MYQYYNAHPKGLLVGDCVKRAITVATQMDYMEVQHALNRHKKVTGAKKFNSDYNPHSYVETVLHGVKMSFPAKKGQVRMNGDRFCKAYPKGHYILNMAGHWSCCVDGVIYDTWDCSEKCVYTAYQVTPVNKIDDSLYEKAFMLVGAPYNKVTLHIYEDKDTHREVTLDAKESLGYMKCLKDLGYIRRHNL